MRTKILITGIVQGVGFRPFVHSLAVRHGLSGYVLNTGVGVEIEIQGSAGAVESFVTDLPLKAPPLAVIESLRVEEAPESVADAFQIRESREEGEKFSLISPDIATCDDCIDELNDPSDRRFGYPFINCTNCGPRFTIIRDVPYDRPKTTMAAFEMCPDCAREYADPADRRFHAQPDACAVCGPSVSFVDAAGDCVADRQDAVAVAARMLREGRVIAVKGIGGYHLACLAGSEAAVHALRSRKFREDKPFAVMAASVAVARELCEISPAEETALLSVRRPIVLCRRKPCAKVAHSVAPGHKFVGVMLPYAPLHHLLLAAVGEPLVMTSGNRSDEPIAFRDGDVAARIKGIPDAYLVHNREIHTRCDDSVLRVWRGAEYLIRRSRGYAPAPVKMSIPTPAPILACGAELKNTFCLSRGEYAFLSHHIGDLDNLETLASFEEGVSHFEKLFHIKPAVLAYDLHPEYLSTKYALARTDVGVKIGMQHHHAHIAACLADNREAGPVIGVSMDGLGYGPDGTLWGGEWLISNYIGFVRAAHLAPLPMPGGTLAIKQPWRMAAAAMKRLCGAPPDLYLKELFNRKEEELSIVDTAIERGINCPETTSMGRLFDAVSALITGRSEINYEGQAAVELELAASDSFKGVYPYVVEHPAEQPYSWGTPPAEAKGIPAMRVNFGATIDAVLADLKSGAGRPGMASRFHSTVAAAISEVCGVIRDKCGIATVALSGGVFQNLRLLEETVSLLERAGFRVLTHSRVPTNDGGLSLGQTAIAAELLKNGAV